MGQWLRVQWITLRAALPWDQVKTLSNSRFLKSASTLLIAIPWVFYMASSLDIFEHLGMIGFSVWNLISYEMLRLVFFGGVVIIMAYIIYLVRCPPFIKNYSEQDAARFAERENDLSSDFASMVRYSNNNNDVMNSVAHFAKTMGHPLPESDIEKLKVDLTYAEQILFGIKVPQHLRGDAFRAVYEFARRLRWWSRLSCIVLFVIGAVLISLPYLQRVYLFLSAELES